jgi:glycosyltransferase involved in cell wall biosynthesis
MKIVYMSDSPTIPTGYGRVGKVLCQSFIDNGHEVEVIGWGYDGSPHNLPYKIIPCDTHQERFGEDILANYIRNEKPDILFTLGDPWMVEYVPYMEERSAVTWVSYFPIDGFPIPKPWHDWINQCDVPVVFSKFAQNLIEQTIGRKPSLIYHGVNTDVFKPLDKQEVRDSYGVGDKFVVGTVARNQPRKNLPALIKAFSIFAKNKPDTLLYMHTQIQDVGWNIDEIVNRFEVSDKAFTTGGFNAYKGVSDEELVRIYNMFDIFVLPTMAEGFGLPILEAQACGIPVLVTDFSACSELVVDRQELLKVKDTIIMGRNIEQAIVDVDDIVRKLNFFYNDWKMHKGKKLNYYSTEGVKLAKELDWNIITNDFNTLLKRIEPKAVARPKKVIPSFYVL